MATSRLCGNIGAGKYNDGSPGNRLALAQKLADGMKRAWEDFVAAETAAVPLLIVLEDLHWGDLPTVTWIDGALDRLKNRPLMVLGVGLASTLIDTIVTSPQFLKIRGRLFEQSTE